MSTFPYFLFKTQTIEHFSFESQTTREIQLDEPWIKELSGWTSETKEAIELRSFKQIILPFPRFVDGRSYSLARLLRGPLQYQGQLLASGEIALDQVPYLYEVGFDGFEVPASPLNQNLESIQSITQRLLDRPAQYQKRLKHPS